MGTLGYKGTLDLLLLGTPRLQSGGEGVHSEVAGGGGMRCLARGPRARGEQPGWG